MGDGRFLQMRTLGTCLQERRRRLVDPVHDGQVLEGCLACTGSPAGSPGAGAALAMRGTMDRSWKVALPAPAPPPEAMEPAFVTPHENESTSISFLCLSSSDSPLISPSFAKMSDAIGHSYEAFHVGPGVRENAVQ